MDRIIQFRAWDKLAKAMSPHFSLFGEFTLLGAVHEWQWEVLQKSPRDASQYDSLGRLNDLVIMQFTGLKDKSGKEIYEGDICQIHYYHDKTIPSPIGIVDWIDSGFSIRAVKNIDNTAMTGIYSLRFKSGGHFGDSPAVEVIGNIYSNPELLKP